MAGVRGQFMAMDNISSDEIVHNCQEGE